VAWHVKVGGKGRLNPRYLVGPDSYGHRQKVMCPIDLFFAKVKPGNPQNKTKCCKAEKLTRPPALEYKKAATPASVDDLSKSNPTTPRA
jgi:hypothetical protein